MTRQYNNITQCSIVNNNNNVIQHKKVNNMTIQFISTLQ